MPTILYVQGWRFHFYSNKGSEPMHIHAEKGDAECKYWLHADRFDIVEDFEYKCTPRLRREVRKIIFEHFDELLGLAKYGDKCHRHVGQVVNLQDPEGTPVNPLRRAVNRPRRADCQSAAGCHPAYKACSA
jgi:hypothetical protein